MLNAKYAISVARQIGCCIFLLWEDIVEVNNKMILTFVGSLTVLATSKGHTVITHRKPENSEESSGRRSISRRSSMLNFRKSTEILPQTQ